MNRDDGISMLRAIAHAFDTHDLDGIMRHFADDAVFESPRGSEAFGTRVIGAAAVREAFAARFAGIPDVRYQQDEHFVDGDRGPRSGPSRARRPMASASRFGAVTCGRSGTGRSSRRTATGRSGLRSREPAQSKRTSTGAAGRRSRK